MARRLKRLALAVVIFAGALTALLSAATGTAHAETLACRSGSSKDAGRNYCPPGLTPIVDLGGACGCYSPPTRPACYCPEGHRVERFRNASGNFDERCVAPSGRTAFTLRNGWFAGGTCGCDVGEIARDTGGGTFTCQVYEAASCTEGALVNGMGEPDLAALEAERRVAEGSLFRADARYCDCPDGYTVADRGAGVFGCFAQRPE